MATLKAYCNFVNRYWNTKASHLRKNRIHPRQQGYPFPIGALSATWRPNETILIWNKWFEVPVTELCIRFKFIKNKIVSVYTIDMIWFTFNFDSLWWIKPTDNIKTKIPTQFSWCERNEIRISSSSLTRNRKYGLQPFLPSNFLKADHLFITLNVSLKKVEKCQNNTLVLLKLLT